ncbi:MAG: cysteine--tRNA ligase [Candidatus Aminicenantes bacterium]|nr:cysteine--tRNA ligase [Candidatus Aminicenantes bacterium]NIM79870.1 cysteine--tRNA ligase [Candidatus Aminicenantes bacterium]NIN19206.1 cysteine--tRNA ligase [Candidatus Aminicenantes bacterium]NIN43111.1 cysteine--tRNA ligase [Candidatus Aminicenantes bacterium]NIN85848.1 cysteine--tRNA ligase [Candidatus Aminicenantes bacterium]
MKHTILDTIGNTPLVEIKHLNPNPGVKILAKLEYFNPGGSVKDRAALYMINAGEKSGELTKEKIVIEATSGNTGIGLALVCSIKGYKLLLAMSENVSLERRKILEARGADILLTPGRLGTDGAIEEVYRLVRENPETYFITDQFNNEANWKAHYMGTAVEIWDQTKGQVSKVVATMGTTGTLMGVSRRLKEFNPEIQIIGVEPYLGHKIQGLKNMKEAYRPGIFEKNRLDEKINIEDDEAFEMTRRLAKEEGLFVGMSSGAAMAAAAKVAETMTDGTIVVIFPDNGERYLSTSVFDVKEKTCIKLFNTLTRTKDIFASIVPGKVSMYTCGPTAHARMHIGECRRFLFTDLLRRYLEYRGLQVTHIINITDINDKTIKGSEEAGMDLAEFTGQHIETFKKDLETLHIKPAAKYTQSSEHINDMVRLAEQLVDKHAAYEKLRSIYFNISGFPGYGELSGVDIDKIRVGATVDLDEYEKDNPRDFTLLKRISLWELKRGIYTKTKWGNIRPSWHIQCAAVSMKHLGGSFDIHASTREHIFPHHENVRAIAKAVTGKPLARYWLHCDRVLVEGKKVDEKGAGPTMADLAEMGFSPKEIRYWLISTHYRKPLYFSRERLENTKHSLKRLNACLEALLNAGAGTRVSSPPEQDLDQLIYDLKSGFTDAMDDDLNISAAMASIFKIVKKLNILINKNSIDIAGASRVIDAFCDIDKVLGVFDFEQTLADKNIRQLIKQRDKARKEKNWKLADEIRDRLTAKGVSIRDSKLNELLSPKP